MKKRIVLQKISSLLVFALLLTGCSAKATDTTLESESNDVTASESEEATPSHNNNDLIKHHTAVHEYNHGTDGYYNLLDDGVEFELIGQISGTCWACASSCAMQTAYQKNQEGSISIDQMEIVDRVYDKDKPEGIFTNYSDVGNLGGVGSFAVNELSLGFSDGLVIDGAIDAQGWTADEIKEGIQKYGALYIGIPDSYPNKKGTHDQYYTMNTPNPGVNEFDHSIAVIGWDDYFPKEYFNEEASQDGAWITYNSGHPYDYYYVSYDTPFDQKYDTPWFISVTEQYGKVLSHDHGYWLEEPIVTGENTTVANVFQGEGTLAAVGTYSLADNQDITIQIMTPDLAECIYTQEAHLDLTGYHVIALNQPQEVDEYAIAITYPKGAPVEGESKELARFLNVVTVCESGQSFVRIDDTWLDMSEASTNERCGRVTGNACIRALYTK